MYPSLIIHSCNYFAENATIIIPSGFLPFGFTYGDFRVPTSLDGSTEGIQLETDIVIFGSRQNRLYVSFTLFIIINPLYLWRLMILGEHKWCALIWAALSSIFLFWFKL